MTQTLAGMLIAQKSGEAAKAGPIGLAVILLLCIVCYFLFKSMSRHMRNVRENFPAQEPVQRVKAPSVHPAALAEPQHLVMESRTNGKRTVDRPDEVAADPDSDAAPPETSP